ncbi:MAG: FAD-binding oxidoreductase [Polyangiaceae bacterium]|nr:FAD-binding oxidoreductase [Polyangiaceae bacterium]
MTQTRKATPALLEAIEKRCGAGVVTTDPSDLAELGRDWTRVFAPAPSAIALPRTTADVSAIVSMCNDANVAVVPSGGRTGLAGGAVAKDGELVLSLTRMSAIGEIDVVGRTVRVEAGAVTQAVHERCAEHDLTWPVDFASKGSSHVGGNIATNAGGIRVIRYGLTRNWVLGLEVVLANGDVLEMGRALEKNNTGIDLKQLFIGSEGILGVITAATLKLTRLPREHDVMLFSLPDLGAVVRLFRAAQEAPFALGAFEFFTDKCLARVQRHRKLASPLNENGQCFVVLEAERGEANEAWLADVFGRGLVLDGTMAQHTSQAASLWALRESISESLSATGLPHKNDIALPIAKLEGFCRDLESILAERYPGWEVCLFGHIGDGNLHVNIMKPDDMDKAAFLGRTHDVDRHMFELVQSYGGSISAEHGIGLLKKDYLGYSRSPAEIAAMKAVKAALDPKNTLNPGKIFDA